MLNRYLREQRGGTTDDRRRRPAIASSCNDVRAATRWRLDVERDIRQRVSEIQNPAVGDERARELNDTINKLLRERGHWDRQVVALGGRATRGLQHDAAFSHGGYMYFGAARNLPEVKEVLEKAQAQVETQVRESVAELRARLDHRYYGVAGDEDEIGEAEVKLRAKLAAEWTKPAEEPRPWDRSFEKYVAWKPPPPSVTGAHSEARDESVARVREQAKQDALQLLRAGSKQ